MRYKNQYDKARKRWVNTVGYSLLASLTVGLLMISVAKELANREIVRLAGPAYAAPMARPDKKPALTLPEQVWDLLAAAGLPLEARVKGMAIVDCESKWDQYAIGDGGKSHGLWQIYEPSNPNISRACKFNVECSTAEAIKIYRKSGNSWQQWTCGR